MGAGMHETWASFRYVLYFDDHHMCTFLNKRVDNFLVRLLCTGESGAGSSDTLVSLFSAPQRSFLLAGCSSNSTQCITFLFKTGRYPTKFHHRRRGEKGIFWALDHEFVAFFNVALYSLCAWNISVFYIGFKKKPQKNRSLLVIDRLTNTSY